MDDVRVIDRTINGQCSGCGDCCGGVLPLSEAEVKRIRQYIKAHNIKEQKHHGRIGIDLTCPFRDEVRKKCLIYEVRPEICRQFLCNYSIQDIREAKRHFHDINQIVYMRNEFFGNSEALDYMKMLGKMVFDRVFNAERE